MTLMTAAEAAVRVLEKEGVDVAFGVPGAAINPLYAAMKKRQSIDHVLARHVEGASHMAEGYNRASPGNRAEERSVGKECVSKGRSRWTPSHDKTKQTNKETEKAQK